ncbi:methyltransferase domain-containing protein, partial [Xanthomonas citri pv. citri]
MFAARLASGKRVLDLGSGEGYGSALLAASAAAVLGVEIDADSVEHARRNYRLENLEFRQGSILELGDLPGGAIDVIVCFGVIEHISEHEALMSLVRRALAPGGLFVVSTPDREIYSEAANYRNPYHVKGAEP